MVPHRRTALGQSRRLTLGLRLPVYPNERTSPYRPVGPVCQQWTLARTSDGASAWFAETDRPTNTDQRFIWIRNGKFVHPPQLVFSRFSKFVSRSVNKWVSARHQPSLHSIGRT